MSIFLAVHLGVSENSVPLNPMVLLIIIPMKNGYFIGNINPTFSGPNPSIFGITKDIVFSVKKSGAACCLGSSSCVMFVAPWVQQKMSKSN